MREQRTALLFLVCILTGLLAVYAIYRPGLASGPFYDDHPNLGNLSDVVDLPSALGFALSGSAGPLGRPLALLSFALNAPSWPSAMDDFLHVNVCIHLLNGLLVLWLAYRLAPSLPQRRYRPEWFALSVAGLWLAHPLLVSASLMTIQRMATLSATFVLAGLIAFVTGQEKLSRRPQSGLWQMSLGIAAGTALAALCKENGALLPLLALVVWATLMQPQAAGKPAWLVWWRRALLTAPNLVLLVYFAATWQGIAGAYQLRDFTLTERLLTQPRVLGDYLQLIIVPTRSALGPFHDDYAPSAGLLDPPSTLLYLVFWTALFAGALAWRKRFPVPAFGILWFLAGHSIEASVFALENYFEHRNYLPALGPIVVFCHYAWNAMGDLKIPLRLMLGVYAALLILVGSATTQVWRDRGLAAELWHREHPGSERAAQFLAQIYSARGDQARARDLVADVARRHPNNIGLALQVAQGGCGLGNEQAVFDALLSPPSLRMLRQGRPTTLICDALTNTSHMIIARECGPVQSGTLHRVMEAILENPRLRLMPDVRYCLHDIQAMLFYHERDLENTMRHLELAFSYKQFFQLAVRLVEIPAGAGLYDAALENLQMALERKPQNPIYARIWQEKLLELKARIETARQAELRQQDAPKLER